MIARQSASGTLSRRVLAVVMALSLVFGAVLGLTSQDKAYADGEIDISQATIADIPDQTWEMLYTDNYGDKYMMRTDVPITPALTVTYDGATLVKDTDYTVEYTNNAQVGTATATITGIGGYTGTNSTTFTIKAPTFAPSINYRDYRYGAHSAVYTDPAEFQGKIWYKTVDGETWKGTNRYDELTGGQLQIYVGSGITGAELVIPEGTTLYIGGPFFIVAGGSGSAPVAHISGGGTVKRMDGYSGPLFVLQPAANNSSAKMTLTFDNITFDGSNAANAASLVLLDSNSSSKNSQGTFTFNNCTFKDSHANSKANNYDWSLYTTNYYTGGALVVGEKVATVLNNCTISNCSAKNGGGAISIERVTTANTGSVTLNNTTINGCSSSDGQGGAIKFDDGNNGYGKLIMTGSTISGCTAVRGGGIAAVSANSSLTFDGATVTNNSADFGAGVYANCPVTVTGATNITGNVGATGDEDTACGNLFLMSATAYLTAALPSGASVGVMSGDEETPNPVVIQGATDSTGLTSDVEGLEFKALGGNLVIDMGKVDTRDLVAAISAAQADADGAVISVDGADIEPTVLWNTQEQKDTLLAAIATAQAVADAANENPPAKTQAEVDDAVAVLNTAKQAFDDAKQYGTKVMTPALEAAIQAAQSDIDSSIISVDGTDVDPANVWTTAEAKQTLEAAIAAAQNLVDTANLPGGPTQAQVDEAVTTVNNAKQAFDESKTAGLAPTLSALSLTSGTIAQDSATISGANRTVTVKMPYNADLSALTVTYTATNSGVLYQDSYVQGGGESNDALAMVSGEAVIDGSEGQVTAYLGSNTTAFPWTILVQKSDPVYSFSIAAGEGHPYAIGSQPYASEPYALVKVTNTGTGPLSGLLKINNSTPPGRNGSYQSRSSIDTLASGTNIGFQRIGSNVSGSYYRNVVEGNWSYFTLSWADRDSEWDGVLQPGESANLKVQVKPTVAVGGAYQTRIGIRADKASGTTGIQQVSSITVTIVKADAATPTIEAVDASYYGAADGKLTITNADAYPAGVAFEVSSDNGETWADATVSEGAITGLTAGTYIVRVKGDANFNASEASEAATIGQPDPTYIITPSGGNQRPQTVTYGFAAEDAPGATYTITNGGTGTLTGIKEKTEITDYSFGTSDPENFELTWEDGFDGTLAAGASTTVKMSLKVGTGTGSHYAAFVAGSNEAMYNPGFFNNFFVQITVNPATQPAPVLSATDATAASAEDGSLTITNFADFPEGAQFEISCDGGAWSAATVSEGQITGLAAGSYQVRAKAITNYSASAASEAAVISFPYEDQPKPVISATDATYYGAEDGKLTITNFADFPEGAQFEISSDGETWADATVAEGQIAGLDAGTYQVRAKTIVGYNASEASEAATIGQPDPTYIITPSGGNPQPQTVTYGFTAEEAPGATYTITNGGTGTLTGIKEKSQITDYPFIDTSDPENFEFTWEEGFDGTLAAGASTTVKMTLKVGTPAGHHYAAFVAGSNEAMYNPGFFNNYSVQITVNPAAQPVPVLSATDATAYGAEDGALTITNLSDFPEGAQFEISCDGGAWVAATVSEGQITGLAAGSYQVRAKAITNYGVSEASEAAIVGPIVNVGDAFQANVTLTSAEGTDTQIPCWFTITSLEDGALAVEVRADDNALGGGEKAIDRASAGELTIPAKVSYAGVDFAVTALGDNCFGSWSQTGTECDAITAVHLPETVATLSKGCLADLSALVSVDMPGVTTVGDSAFKNDFILEMESLPEGIANVGAEAFSGDKAVSFMSFPASLESAGDSIFSGDSNLKAVAFMGDTSDVTFGSSLGNASGLQAVIFHDDVTAADLGTSVPQYGAIVYYASAEDLESGDALATVAIEIGTAPTACSFYADADHGYAAAIPAGYWNYQEGVLDESGNVVRGGAAVFATPKVSITPDAVTNGLFADLTYGYAAEDATTVVYKVTNTGGAALSNLAIATTCEKFSCDVESVESLAPGKSVLVSVTPAVGLDAGAHICALKVSVDGEEMGAAVLAQTVAKAEQAAPTGLVAQPETVKGAGNGSITGLDESATYEFKPVDGDMYFKISGTDTINWLDPGTYLVRFAETDNCFAGEAVELVVEEGEEAAWTRIAGSSRYATSAEIAKAGFEHADTVILATGANFPDALAASGLAGLNDAPVLLTETASLSNEAALAIEELGASKAIIIGGTGAVSANVESTLKSMLGADNVSRIAGASRTDTSVEIFKAGQGWSDTCIITTGFGYADALSVSPLSYAKKMPIFLANSKGTLDASVAAAIQEAGFQHAIIVGGTGAVSDAVKAQMGIDDVVRLAGANRYDTSLEIARYSIYEQGMSVDNLACATGANYPDGLAGGAFCGAKGSVLMLVADGASTVSAIDGFRSGISTGYFLGGTGAISEALAKIIEGNA